MRLYICTFRRRKVVEKSPARINRSRDYSPLDNPPTGGFHSKELKCPKYGLRTSIIFTSVTALLLRYVHVTYGKIAARPARGYGVLYEVPVFSAQVLFFYIVMQLCSQQNQLFCPACLRQDNFYKC